MEFHFLTNKKLQAMLLEIYHLHGHKDEVLARDPNALLEIGNRFIEVFYRDYDHELRFGKKALDDLVSLIKGEALLKRATYETQHDVKRPEKLDSKIASILQVGGAVADVYRGRSIIQNPNVPDKAYDNLKRYLVRIKRSDLLGKIDWRAIDFEHLQNNMRSSHLERLIALYRENVEPYHITQLHSFAERFERFIESRGGTILNPNDYPFTYDGYDVTVATQVYTPSLDPGRRLDADILRFINEHEAVRFVNKLIEGKKHQGIEVIQQKSGCFYYLDTEENKVFISTKDNLVVAMRNESKETDIKISVEDCIKLSDALYLKRKDGKIRRRGREESARDFALSVDYAPGWGIETPIREDNERISDINRIIEQYSICMNRDTISLLSYEPTADRKRYLDFVEKEKKNRYQSLHYKILWEGFLIEWQLRTRLMHFVAEKGSASHICYDGERYGRFLEEAEIILKDVFSDREGFTNRLDSARVDGIKHNATDLSARFKKLSIDEAAREFDNLIERYVELVQDGFSLEHLRRDLAFLPHSFYEGTGLGTLQRYNELGRLYESIEVANSMLEDERDHIPILDQDMTMTVNKGEVTEEDMLEDEFTSSSNGGMRQSDRVKLLHYNAMVNTLESVLGKKPSKSKIKWSLFGYGLLELIKDYEKRFGGLPTEGSYASLSDKLQELEQNLGNTLKGITKKGQISRQAGAWSRFERTRIKYLPEEMKMHFNLHDLHYLGGNNLGYMVHKVCQYIKGKVAEIEQNMVENR